jgi:hypothetical protein
MNLAVFFSFFFFPHFWRLKTSPETLISRIYNLLFPFLAIRLLGRRSGAASRALHDCCLLLAGWLARCKRSDIECEKLNLGVARVGFLSLYWIAAVVVAVVVVAMDAAGRPAVVIDNGTGYFPSVCMLLTLCFSLSLCDYVCFSFLFFPTYLLKVMKISGSLDLLFLKWSVPDRRRI